ncbi:MAG: ester cyclase [Actinomycetota bacterium]|nr:ester cyclase [Actinomycetota bacterium]
MDIRGWLVAVARRPASWAAVSAVAGGILGTAVMWWCAILPSDFGVLGCSISLFSGGVEISLLFTTVSLAGAVALLAERFRILSWIAGAFVALLALATFSWFFLDGPPGLSPLLLWQQVPFEPGPPQYATITAFWGRPIVMVLLGAALLWARLWSSALLLLLLGALETFVLTVPFVPVAGSSEGREWFVLLLGIPGFLTPGLIGTTFWVSLGAAIFLSDRTLEREKLEEKQQKAAEENRRKARRLYQEAFGAGDLSVVDALVAEDFFDHSHNRRGREEFRRSIASLRRAFPDLGVRVEEQTAEDDTVTTCCTLSGTDLGGVLWYPPTGKPATFSGVYVDRFSGGLFVEHGGGISTARLLEQLGLPPSSTSG